MDQYRFGGPAGSAADPRLDALLQAIAAGDEPVAEQAVQDLRSLPEAEGRNLAGWLADHPEADIRWWGVRLAAVIPESGGLLSKALHDASETVRACAMLGLRQQPAAQALDSLLNALDDPSPLIWRLAADALAALGEPALPGLIERLQLPDASAARGAACALAQMQRKEAIPALFNALDHESWVVRYWAEHGLEKLGVGMTFFNAGG